MRHYTDLSNARAAPASEIISIYNTALPDVLIRSLKLKCKFINRYSKQLFSKQTENNKINNI